MTFSLSLPEMKVKKKNPNILLLLSLALFTVLQLYNIVSFWYNAFTFYNLCL